ncbi:hypothetical protein Moror_1558 [Moniliophthora roreri MCA 2997]|uniref:Uncharacterized protein n=1 Tax=Moniliophthora roreri (strain MCA 2997) TaxID=1381753 RepID=V2XIJ9_MONRO|nr:hypothetical protein Moror_1558 [Moniliophthora roreri MCA 2997]KAI3612997.1 hypothetical protein WG66_005304 [Moniliophthora roreri]
MTTADTSLIPPQCDKPGFACAVVRPFLENPQCQPRFCCTETIQRNIVGCYTCIGQIQNITDYPGLLSALDHYVQLCNVSGISLDRTMSPAQVASRTVTLPSASSLPTTSPSAPTDATSRKTTAVGTIVGAVAGGAMLIALLIACSFYFHRKRVSQHNLLSAESVISPYPDVNTGTQRGHKRSGNTSGDSRWRQEEQSSIEAVEMPPRYEV